MALFVPHWFDLLVFAALVVGFLSGRKKGMSEELLDVLQWLAIAIITPRLSDGPARALAAWTQFSLEPILVISYLLFALLIKIGFAGIRNFAGQKLIGKDFFGNWEYPLGIIGGIVRIGCIVLVGLALLSAANVTDEDIYELERKQRENFGNISFPTIQSLHQEVFKHSHAGRFVRFFFSNELILPVAGSEHHPNHDPQRIERFIN